MSSIIFNGYIAPFRVLQKACVCAHLVSYPTPLITLVISNSWNCWKFDHYVLLLKAGLSYAWVRYRKFLSVAKALPIYRFTDLSNYPLHTVQRSTPPALAALSSSWAWARPSSRYKSTLFGITLRCSFSEGLTRFHDIFRYFMRPDSDTERVCEGGWCEGHLPVRQLLPEGHCHGGQRQGRRQASHHTQVILFCKTYFKFLKFWNSSQQMLTEMFSNL